MYATRNRWPALIVAILAFAALPALGADYPTKSIRMIVPFVPGGGTDLLARLITPNLSEQLGQQIVVDNRGGAGSVVGTQLVARAVPDGYTMGLFDTAFAINPAVFSKLPYDSTREFVFVAIIATSPTLLIARPGLKVKTIQEFVALAKSSPGKIKQASAGVGSASHLTGAMLQTAAKIDFVHVPFKGAGAAVIDVLGGHTDFTFVVPGTVRQHIQSGSLVGLAIAAKRPSPNAPGVPTFESVGLGAVAPGSFRFVAAPAGIPQPILQRWIAELRKVMATTELQQRLIDNDFDPAAFLPHPQSRGFIETEWSKWRVAVKTAGVKPN